MEFMWFESPAASGYKGGALIVVVNTQYRCFPPWFLRKGILDIGFQRVPGGGRGEV
jgi:hypothetical protein